MEAVVLSQDSWNSIQETIRVMENDYLSEKVLEGMSQVNGKKTVGHDLL